CIYAGLRTYMGMRGFIEIGMRTTIPNFIMLSISLKSLDFQGLPESDAFGLRHFRMDLYARKPCLIQIAAQHIPVFARAVETPFSL
ncbi:MAG: hypothetical protein PUH09_05060, partial [Eubacteriales bacterium]|nr:hypothetical protein [Eubacteriales bacterium]